MACFTDLTITSITVALWVQQLATSHTHSLNVHYSKGHHGNISRSNCSSKFQINSSIWRRTHTSNEPSPVIKPPHVPIPQHIRRLVNLRHHLSCRLCRRRPTLYAIGMVLDAQLAVRSLDLLRSRRLGHA